MLLTDKHLIHWEIETKSEMRGMRLSVFTRRLYCTGVGARSVHAALQRCGPVPARRDGRAAARRGGVRGGGSSAFGGARAISRDFERALGEVGEDLM